MKIRLFAKLAGICILVIAVSAFVVAPITKAATEEEIENSIEAGISWLADMQGGDGSWRSVAETGFAVVKLEDRAFELGHESPFDPAYEYSSNVIAGLDYIFSQAGNSDCCSDKIVFGAGWHECYSTGIAMMAISASRTPDRVVNVAGSLVDGMTYQTVVQANVDYFVCAQYTVNPYTGAWKYSCAEPWVVPDNSNTGYATLGLRYAENFGCTIPQTLKDNLSTYIDYIQNDVDDPIEPNDGGSGYTGPDGWVNLLKTGNLLFEMAFVGDKLADQRVQDAIDYIERHWDDPGWDPGWKGGAGSPERPHMQAAYCLMKGLEAFDIRELDVSGGPFDWFDEMSTAIIGAQVFGEPLGDGYWDYDYWGDEILATEWALLTLEKVAPPPPAIEVSVDIKPGSCPNPLNVKSKGVLPVAILGTEEFDVSIIDPASVKLTLNGNGDGEVLPLRWAYEDVATPFEGELCDCHDYNGDGYMDLTLKFKIQELVGTLDLGSYGGKTIPLTLTGNLMEDYGGTSIYGQDCVRILEK